MNSFFHQIPIMSLSVTYAFDRCEGVDIILRSRTRLSCPPMLVRLTINDSGRELTEAEVAGILAFAQQSPMMTEVA